MAVDLAIKATNDSRTNLRDNIGSEVINVAKEFETYIAGPDGATVDNPTRTEHHDVNIEHREQQQQLELELQCARCGALHIVDMTYDHAYESSRQTVAKSPKKSVNCLDCQRGPGDPRHDPNNLTHGGHAYRPSLRSV